ncbi:MAG TPA: C2H2-type zinc finger protein [Thermomicrobiales bacterium]|nr:C2H2-type zinc finger protein [Thermomicrobiales bacterium]
MTAQAGTYRCPMCGSEFATRAELEQHGRQAHGTQASSSASSQEGGGYRCQMCGAEFATREQLDQHNRQAHGMS